MIGAKCTTIKKVESNSLSVVPCYVVLPGSRFKFLRFYIFLSFLINVVQIGFRFAFLSHPFFSPSTHSHFFKVLISFYCFSTHCRYQLSVVSVSVHYHFPLFKIVLSFSYSRALSSTYRRTDFFHWLSFPIF